METTQNKNTRNRPDCKRCDTSGTVTEKHPSNQNYQRISTKQNNQSVKANHRDDLGSKEMVTTSRLRKLHDRREKEDTNNCYSVGSGVTQMNIVKSPGWIQTQGPLANICLKHVFSKVEDEVYKSGNTDNLFKFFQQKLNNNESLNDMSVVEVIVGIYSVFTVTSDKQGSIKLCKHLRSTLHRYNIKNIGAVSTLLFFCLNHLYIEYGKPGKAYSALEAAQWCIQHHAPSLWTYLVFDMQAKYHDMQAQIQPALRADHQQKAMLFSTNARDHYLHSYCEWDHFYLNPIMYRLDMLHITLDMPTIHTMGDFYDTDIVYHRLTDSVVSQAELTQAQYMLDNVKADVISLDQYKLLINEHISIATVFYHIRQAQLCLKSKTVLCAKSNLEKAFEKLHDWRIQYAPYNNTVLDGLPKLSENMKQVLDNIHNEITIRIDIVLKVKLSKPHRVTSSSSPSSEMENNDDELTKLGQMKVNANSDMDSDVMDIRDHHNTTSTSTSSETQIINVNTNSNIDSDVEKSRKCSYSLSSENNDTNEAIRQINLMNINTDIESDVL